MTTTPHNPEQPTDSEGPHGPRCSGHLHHSHGARCTRDCPTCWGSTVVVPAPDGEVEPERDGRVVAVQMLVDAENAKRYADQEYERASRGRAAAVAKLEEAQQAVAEALGAQR